MHRRTLIPLIAAAALILTASPALAEATVERHDNRITINIDGRHFTDYIVTGYAHPILYPVHGPHGIAMTRNWPMKTVEGEAQDHPHHTSLWFTHGDVNGIDFWADTARPGKIVNESVTHASGGEKATIRSHNRWIGTDGELVCTDVTTITAFGEGEDRVLDYAVTVTAPESHDVRFGDTKEGSMGIRTHPQLRLEPDARRGVPSVTGHAVNSEGVQGKAIWGRHAEWVDYWGQIDGRTVGVAIFDHPDNPRHPTTWHAREYGLIAANPFGLQHFENATPGTGDLLVPAGHAVTFRYRFVFHAGDAESARIAERYDRYAAADHGSR